MLRHKTSTIITVDSAFFSSHTNVKMSFATVKTVKQYALIWYWSLCFLSKEEVRLFITLLNYIDITLKKMSSGHNINSHKITVYVMTNI